MPTKAEMTELIVIVTADRDSSAQRWDAAIKTDDSDRGFASDYAECDAAYDVALKAIERGDLAAAEGALEDACRIEGRGGDNCDAVHALRAVRAALRGQP